MNKQEFLTALRSRLHGLPQSDQQKSLNYYSEIIDDQVEDGLSEEAAVATLGSIDEIVQQIFMETPLPTLVKAKPSRRMKGWEIVLLILGSPIWLPILLAVLVVILGITVTYWSVILALYALDLSFAVCAVVGFVGFASLCWIRQPIQAMALLGVGLIGLGIAILGFFLCNRIVALTLRMNRWFLRRIKSQFI